MVSPPAQRNNTVKAKESERGEKKKEETPSPKISSAKPFNSSET
jgi:hypothetical protein